MTLFILLIEEVLKEENHSGREHERNGFVSNFNEHFFRDSRGRGVVRGPEEKLKDRKHRLVRREIGEEADGLGYARIQNPGQDARSDQAAGTQQTEPAAFSEKACGKHDK